MSLREAIKIAYEKGYRITDDGKLYGLSGKELTVKTHGTQRYPTFAVNVGKLTSSGVYGIPVHKFAAFCFYGEESFNDGFVIRHLDGNVLHISKENIKLGSHSENNMDKDPLVRKASAIKARAAQGIRPYNAKLTEEDVREIRLRYTNGESGYEISKDYEVSNVTIYDIIKGRKYSDVI
jgi:hypothetical protein